MKVSAVNEKDGVAGSDIRLGGLAPAARRLVFERARRRRGAHLPGDGFPGRTVPGFRTGQRVGDLVQDRVGDPLGRAAHSVRPAHQSELLPGTAFAQFRSRVFLGTFFH